MECLLAGVRPLELRLPGLVSQRRMISKLLIQWSSVPGRSLLRLQKLDQLLRRSWPVKKTVESHSRLALRVLTTDVMSPPVSPAWS